MGTKQQNALYFLLTVVLILIFLVLNSKEEKISYRLYIFYR